MSNIRWAPVTNHDAAAFLKTIEGLPGRTIVQTEPSVKAPQLSRGERLLWFQLVQAGMDVNEALLKVRGLV